MRTRWLVVSLVAVGALLVGGCSSNDKASSSDSAASSGDSSKKEGAGAGSSESGGGSSKAPSDVCDLISVEDAQEAVGGIELELEEDVQENACSYTSVDALDMALVQLSYDANSLRGSDLKDVANMAAGMLDDEDSVQKVDGVGDAAYALKIMTVDTLLVAHGDDVITITMMGGGDDGVDAMASLAKTAIEKL